MLQVSLITLGDPGRLSGGYLYHRRMAELAPRLDARVSFVSVPDRLVWPWPARLPFPCPLLPAPSAWRKALRSGADAIVLDSIAAAYLGPSLALAGPLAGARPSPRGPGSNTASCRVPSVIAMLHQPPGGIGFGPLRTATQAWLDCMAYRRCLRLLVASESLACELEARGVPRERMRVVPPGRDVGGASSDPALDLRAGRRCALLCVANWLEHKGILDLIEVFAGLPGDAGTLHLVGDVDADRAYAARVRARLRHSDLMDRVVVHGPLPREAVAALYHAADVFVLPSTREAYGTVYGEAMAAGLPVVGWRAGNLPHLAADGIEGLMVAPGDRDALTRALLELASDDARRTAMGEAAARRAQSLPTWHDSAGMFFGAIREAIEVPSRLDGTRAL